MNTDKTWNELFASVENLTEAEMGRQAQFAADYLCALSKANTKKVLTKKEAAEFLGVDIRYLSFLREKGKIRGPGVWKREESSFYIDSLMGYKAWVSGGGSRRGPGLQIEGIERTEDIERIWGKREVPYGARAIATAYTANPSMEKAEGVVFIWVFGEGLFGTKNGLLRKIHSENIRDLVAEAFDNDRDDS
jgi:hypothetical protein